MPIASGIIQILLLLLPLTVFAGSLEGRTAYRKGDFATAHREFGSDEQFVSVSTYFLALMNLRGEGVPRDESRGLELLRTSADNGYPAAEYLLGQRYFYGRGVARDKDKAKTYLKAAASGDYRAVALLKIIAQGSRGEVKDRESIVSTVKRMARAKDSDAQYTLAFMHLIGDGVPKDAVEEVRWYRAASAHNSRAAFMLSLMYQSGEGVPQNPAEAFRFMRIAAVQGNARAQYFLGTFYYQGVGTEINQQSAGDWFRKSAENGFVDAQLVYGMLLLSGDGVAVDKAKAIEWLSRASRQGNLMARDVLRELLTFRGQAVATPMTDTAMSVYNTEKQKAENQLRLEGKGVLLDQGSFGLKFSLPTLYDAYEPKDQATPRPLKQNFQGGTLDIIIRSF